MFNVARDVNQIKFIILMKGGIPEEKEPEGFVTDANVLKAIPEVNLT